jgi:alkylhydroperoxidase family enzyme
MSCIEPVQPPYAPRVAEDLEKLMPPGMEPIALFRVVAKNPRVLRRLRRGGLLDPGSVSLRSRELMILRTTALCGAEYEWGVHVRFFGAAAGLDDEQLRSTVLGDARDSCWSAEDALVIELADLLHERATVPPERWTALREVFDEAQLIELLMLAGQYHAVSFLVNGAGLGREPGTPAFPSG